MEPEKQEPIIVYRSFASSMDGNLAKAKLDAFGIPCFLTDENLASLYPIHNPRFSVRLHIFEKDYEQVHEVLSEMVPLEDEGVTRCPRCHSTRIEKVFTRKPMSRFMTIFISLTIRLFPIHQVNRCQNCQYEF